MNKRTLAAICAVAILSGPAMAQAPAISREAMEAAQALSAYQRGQTMQRNAAGRLCTLGQAQYCGEAREPAAQTGLNPPNASGGQTTAQPATPGGRR